MIVRSDLPAGSAAAQIVHAAGESSPGDLPSGTFAVVLSVPTELGLRAVAARLTAAGLPFVEIVESDEPYSGQLMAIGVRPVLRSIARKAMSSLPLYRGPASAGVPERGGSKPAPAPGGVVQLKSAVA